MFTITRCVPFLFSPSISVLRISGELYSVTSPLISTTVAFPDWRVEIFTKDGPCCLLPPPLRTCARNRAKRSNDQLMVLHGAGTGRGNPRLFVTSHPWTEPPPQPYRRLANSFLPRCGAISCFRPGVRPLKPPRGP